MKKTSFYPGPSQVDKNIAKYVKRAYGKGILSMNHRSPVFVALSSETISLLRSKLMVPDGYVILFASSATECWEIIAQSLIEDGSLHLFNGAFGEKWFSYTKKLRTKAKGVAFSPEEPFPHHKVKSNNDFDFICLTQNETSNGTQVSNEHLREIRKSHPGKLIAVDATSSMAGVHLDFRNADVWFASVQKCFGLPAGLALMICSKKAVQKARKVNERQHYNSLCFMLDKMEDWQTTLTPNVLNIYLLNQVLKRRKGIRKIYKKTATRFQLWQSFIEGHSHLDFLVENKETRSETVLTIKLNEPALSDLKENAKREGLVLGNGYGILKKETFRIANFPAIPDKGIERLMVFLKGHNK